MARRPRSAAAALLAPLALASCVSFTFDSQEIGLRLRPEEDAVELLLVYDGVAPDGDDEADVERAVQSLGEILAGRRRVVLLGFPLEFDLDDLELADELPPGSKRELREQVEQVELLDVALARHDDRLVLHQRFRLDRAGRALELANAYWSDAVLEIDRTDGAPDEDDMDARTWELWVAHATEGGVWVVLDAGGLEVRLPASGLGAARMVTACTTELISAPGVEAGDPHPLLESLASVHFEDELLTVRFGTDASGVVRLPLPLRSTEAPADFVEALERAEVPLSPAEATDRARRALAGD